MKEVIKVTYIPPWSMWFGVRAFRIGVNQWGYSVSQVPLRYLIAMLFINFKPLWDPVIELLV